MSRSDDAIIVGARCAGSPLAMLLARMGPRVPLVDRAKLCAPENLRAPTARARQQAPSTPEMRVH